jgi:hypothetical protein
VYFADAMPSQGRDSGEASNESASAGISDDRALGGAVRDAELLRVAFLALAIAVILAAIGAAGAAFAFVPTRAAAAASNPESPQAIAAAENQPDPQRRCGVERWSVKTASDALAAQIKPAERTTTVAALNAETRVPPTIGPRLSRSPPLEFEVLRLRDVDLRQVRYVGRRNEDRDIHLVVADRGSSKEMIVELPDTTCPGADRSRFGGPMAAARHSFEQACGGQPPKSFVALTGNATIVGVGYYDKRHGQLGVADSGVELHPVLGFSSTNCKRVN